MDVRWCMNSDGIRPENPICIHYTLDIVYTQFCMYVFSIYMTHIPKKGRDIASFNLRTLQPDG